MLALLSWAHVAPCGQGDTLRAICPRNNRLRACCCIGGPIHQLRSANFVCLGCRYLKADLLNTERADIESRIRLKTNPKAVLRLDCQLHKLAAQAAQLTIRRGFKIYFQKLRGKPPGSPWEGGIWVNEIGKPCLS